MDFEIVNYYFSVDAVIRRAAETETKLLQIPSSSTGRGPLNFATLYFFLFIIGNFSLSSFVPPNGRVFLMQHSSMLTHQVALHSNLNKKETYKNKIKYVLTRSLFSANLLKFDWCSIDGINFATLLCFTGNLPRVLFAATGRQFEGVAYCTSWRFVLRVAYFTKPLRPRRGVHSMNGYISMHFLLGITRFASGPFWNIK